jgi:hypothetical protein
MSSGAFSTVVDTRRELPAAMASGAINQTVSIGFSAAQSAVFNHRTTLIRIFNTVDCFIEVGESPVATSADSIFCAGGIYHYFGVKPNERLSVIAGSPTAGTLYLMEVGE